MSKNGYMPLHLAAKKMKVDNKYLKDIAKDGRIPEAFRAKDSQGRAHWLYVPDWWVEDVLERGLEKALKAPLKPSQSLSKGFEGVNEGDPAVGDPYAPQEPLDGDPDMDAPETPDEFPAFPAEPDGGSFGPGPAMEVQEVDPAPAPAPSPAAPRRTSPRSRTAAPLTDAEEGLAALGATREAAVPRNVKVFQQDPATGKFIYKTEFTHFPRNPYKAIQQIAPEGGNFRISYFHPKRRKDVVYPVEIAPAPMMGGPPPHGGMAMDDHFGGPVDQFGHPVGGPPPPMPGADWQGPLVGKLADAALSGGGGGADPSDVLGVYQEGQQATHGLANTLFQQMREASNAEREQHQRTMERISHQAEHDKSRDREWMGMQQEMFKNASEERLEHTKTFFESMMKSNKDVVDLQKTHNEQIHQLHMQILEMQKQNFDEIRELKLSQDRQTIWEPLFKTVGDMAKTFGDKIEPILKTIQQQQAGAAGGLPPGQVGLPPRPMPPIPPARRPRPPAPPAQSGAARTRIVQPPSAEPTETPRVANKDAKSLITQPDLSGKGTPPPPAPPADQVPPAPPADQVPPAPPADQVPPAAPADQVDPTVPAGVEVPPDIAGMEMSEEQILQVVAQATPGELMGFVKHHPGFYPKLIRGASQCLSFDQPAQRMMDDILALVEKDVTVPFVIRAFSSLEDPYFLVVPPFVDRDEKGIEITKEIQQVAADGVAFLKELHGICKKWVQDNPQYFSTNS